MKANILSQSGHCIEQAGLHTHSASVKPGGCAASPRGVDSGEGSAQEETCLRGSEVLLYHGRMLCGKDPKKNHMWDKDQCFQSPLQHPDEK